MSRSLGVGDVSGRFDVLQHWDAESSDALNLVIEEFERRNGNVTVESNSAPISTLRLHVKSQILRENPPNIWSDWPGKNLKPIVETDSVADVTNVWEETQMAAEYAEGAKDAATFDGRYRCVPLDIYRINNLFYNVDHVEEAGVDVDGIADPEEFLEVLAQLDSALDVPAMAIAAKDPFNVLQLWETFVIAYGGAEAYHALLDGNATRYREPIHQALQTLDGVLEYGPEQAKFLGSEDSDSLFATQEAAVTHNGAWAIGRIKATEGFDFGSDWDYRAFPATDDAFQMNMNALVPAIQTEGDEAVEAFLRFAGSVDGLEIFNAEVGAVPPRADVPIENLHPLTRRLKKANERLSNHLPSMTHGLGVSPNHLIDMKAAIGSFMSDRDVDATTEALVDTLSGDES